jgi:hypothetical protein
LRVPLVVSLTLAAPLALPTRLGLYPLHLDALVVSVLAWRQGSLGVWTGEFDPADDPYAPGRNPDVPLAVAERGGVRLYQASAALVPEGAFPLRVFRAGVVKRPPDPGALGSSDWKKSYLEGRFCVWVPRLEFWCVGDPGGLREVLAAVRAVGSARNAGFGQVARADVFPASGADASTWGIFDRQGRPARMVPVAFFPEGEGRGWRRVAAAARPPYWHPVNRELCWAPARPTAPDAAAFWLPDAV